MESRRDKNLVRRRRRTRYIKRVRGIADRPRLAVFRSLQHIYAQAIDDDAGATVASASSVDKEIRKTLAGGGNTSAAKIVGEVLARRLKEKGIGQVVFDRGGCLYHGRVKALAEGARENGLKF